LARCLRIEAEQYRKIDRLIDLTAERGSAAST